MTNEHEIAAIMACADWYRAIDNAGRAKHREKLSSKIAAALAAKDAELERLKARQDPVCWAVIDPSGGGSVEYTAAWKEACHEHISDCITEHDIDWAKGWVVRPLYVAPMLAAEPAKPAPGEWIEWAGGQQPVPDGVLCKTRLEDGDEGARLAENWVWEHDEFGANIVAYRVLP